ncbi:MAG TPA: hypothetical protein DDW54_02590, partial [Clostridiales bacterium]|nr:hypothetical protein [Clostridiales bacterium]
AKKQLADAVQERKDELMQRFREGRVTEYYINKRFEQLDNGKFSDKPPKMFEADQLMSKNDYLNDYAKKFNEKNPNADFSLNELSKEEKNELYQRYVENANRAKEQFILTKYMESEKLLPLRAVKVDGKTFGVSAIPQQTMAERIAAEDARLARLERANGDKTKNAEKDVTKENVEKDKKVDAPEAKQDAPQVENISIDLEDEPQIQDKAEKIEGKGNVKEEEKVVGDDGGERIDIELDDDAVELNDDILNFGDNEKDLVKDPLNK